MSEPSPFLITRPEPGERLAVLLASLYFFCVLCSYSMLRPLREAIGLTRNVDSLSTLFMITLCVTLASNPLLAALMSRYPRRRFIPYAYRFFAVSLAGFAALIHFFPQGVGVTSGQVFFVWLTVYNLFATTLFWAFMVDIFSLEQGKRLFGQIGVGGTLGAVCGAAAAENLAVREIPPAILMLLAAGGLEAAVQCFGALARRTIDRPRATSDDPRTAPASARTAGDVPGGILSGLTDTLRSPYILGMCVYVASIGIAGTFLYFAQARVVSAAAPDLGTRTAAFARIDFWSQSATLLIQVFVTAHVIRGLGVGVTLLLLPALSYGCMVALGTVPTLDMLLIAMVVSRAGQHALARPARETLFTVLSRSEKYRAKSLVDTFVFRAGDALGAIADRGAADRGWRLSLVAIPLALVWGAVALALGVGQRRRAARASAG